MPLLRPWASLPTLVIIIAQRVHSWTESNYWWLPYPQLPNCLHSIFCTRKTSQQGGFFVSAYLVFPFPVTKGCDVLAVRSYHQLLLGTHTQHWVFYLVTRGFWEELDVLCRMITIKLFYMNKHVCEVYKIIVILPHLDFPFPLPFLLPVSYTPPPLRSFFFFLPTISDGYSKWNT